MVAEGGSTLISANASDPDDGVSQVTFLVDGNARATSGAPYQWTYSDIPEGPHTLQVQARDTRGAVATTPARTIYGSRVIGDTGVANGAIFGWACATHFNGSIPVHLYLGGPYGTGVGYGIATANLGSEPAINNQCKGGGGAYRFSIPITDAMVRDHGGKKIYLHGISPVGGGNNVLANGGTFSVPVNSPPTISLVSPGNVQVESPGEIRLVANASDPDDAVAQVAFYRDGNQIAVVGAAPYEFTVSGLAAGSYRFHAVATDRRSATATSNTHTVAVVRGQSPRAVTRTYVYDGNQRLCKTIEPETGATVVDYDAAGNIAWTASGLDLTDAGACNRTEASASGRRVDRAYDALNRVVRIRFPDRNGDQDLSYRNSGEVQSVTTWNDQGKQTTVNSFQYNKRNLLVGESAASTGRPTWSMGYGYDTQGALASMVYPGGLTVSYANNAQGQPLSVSVGGVSYASGVRYHPTGAVQSFSYGNGIVHATQLNARQLPYQQTDAGAMSYRYSYDAIGNVTGIADLQQGAGFDRTLQYDAGQRLIAAGSASFGGDHWHRYSYDARDNLLSASLGGVKDYRYWYDERNRLANILNADGATIIGLSYDAQGNLRSKNGRVHEFDLGNRLRTIQGLESYQYDAAGRRTVTSDGSGDRLRSFYGQGGQLLYEQRRDRGAAEFIMLGSRLLAKRQGRGHLSARGFARQPGGNQQCGRAGDRADTVRALWPVDRQVRRWRGIHWSCFRCCVRARIHAAALLRSADRAIPFGGSIDGVQQSRGRVQPLSVCGQQPLQLHRPRWPAVQGSLQRHRREDSDGDLCEGNARNHEQVRATDGWCLRRGGSCLWKYRSLRLCYGCPRRYFQPDGWSRTGCGLCRGD